MPHATNFMRVRVFFAPPPIPAAEATNAAAWPAFVEYVRCGSRTVSPCWQILSPSWQMTNVFEAGTVPTAVPLFGSPKMRTDSYQHIEEHLMFETCTRVDICGSGCVQHLCCVVDELATLTGKISISDFQVSLEIDDSYLYPLMTTLVFGHCVMACVTNCAIVLLPFASPPAKKPGISAG